jgi:hypothetical protein
MQRFLGKQMKLDEVIEPECDDPAVYFCERDQKYGTSELKLPAVVKLQTDHNVAAPPPTTFEELMTSLDIVPRISQMPQELLDQEVAILGYVLGNHCRMQVSRSCASI